MLMHSTEFLFLVLIFVYSESNQWIKKSMASIGLWVLAFSMRAKNNQRGQISRQMPENGKYK